MKKIEYIKELLMESFEQIEYAKDESENLYKKEIALDTLYDIIDEIYGSLQEGFEYLEKAMSELEDIEEEKINE